MSNNAIISLKSAAYSLAEKYGSDLAIRELNNLISELRSDEVSGYHNHPQAHSNQIYKGTNGGHQWDTSIDQNDR